jgi:glycine/D-amino acid oxidase-like deaminating enzyme
MPKPRIAIVGAGIIGCLIARELAARYPGAPITVLDRDAVGAGASRRSAGLHLPRGSSARIRRMSADSHAYYADLKRAHPGLPIHPIRATVIADNTRIENYLPEARPTPAPKANETTTWHITGAHHTDVPALAQALATQLRPQVTFAEGAAVTGLTQAPDSITLTTSTGARLTIDQVILAPGPWLTAPAWRDLLAPLALRVKRVAALHIDKQPTPADEVVLFDTEDAFLLPLPHRGHWLFSYPSQEWDVEPDQEAGLEDKEFAQALDCLRRCSPTLADACHGGRVFCDAYSPAREPVVRALDPAGRIVFAGAASGSGYRLAPAIAAQTAALVQQGAPGDRQHL